MDGAIAAWLWVLYVWWSNFSHITVKSLHQLSKPGHLQLMPATFFFFQFTLSFFFSFFFLKSCRHLFLFFLFFLQSDANTGANENVQDYERSNAGAQHASLYMHMYYFKNATNTTPEGRIIIPAINQLPVLSVWAWLQANTKKALWNVTDVYVCMNVVCMHVCMHVK